MKRKDYKSKTACTLLFILFYKNNGNQRSFINCIVRSIIFTVMLFLAVFGYFIFRESKTIFNYTGKMWFAICCGATWITFGTWFVHRYWINCKHILIIYQKNILHSSDTIEICINKTQQKLIHINIKKFMWILSILFIITMDVTYLNKYGIKGFSDIYFYIFVFCLIPVLYISGIGFEGIVITKEIVKKILNSDYELDYLDPNNSGGLRPLIDFIIFTTKSIATGILFLPILLDFINFTNSFFVKFLLYGAIVFYSICIWLSYFKPIMTIEKFIENKKSEMVAYVKDQNLQLTNVANHTLKDEFRTINFYNYLSLIKNASVLGETKEMFFQIILAILPSVISGFINLSDITALFDSMFY